MNLSWTTTITAGLAALLLTSAGGLNANHTDYQHRCLTQVVKIILFMSADIPLTTAHEDASKNNG